MVTAMDITIHSSYLPQDDPDAAVAFYRDTLGFEVRNDVEYGGMHSITVGPSTNPTRRSSSTRPPSRRASPTTSGARSPR